MTMRTAFPTILPPLWLSLSPLMGPDSNSCPCRSAGASTTASPSASRGESESGAASRTSVCASVRRLRPSASSAGTYTHRICRSATSHCENAPRCGVPAKPCPCSHLRRFTVWSSATAAGPRGADGLASRGTAAVAPVISTPARRVGRRRRTAATAHAGAAPQARPEN